MYKKEDDSIEIIYKDGSTCDIAKASDMLNISLPVSYTHLDVYKRQLYSIYLE